MKTEIKAPSPQNDEQVIAYDNALDGFESWVSHGEHNVMGQDSTIEYLGPYDGTSVIVVEVAPDSLLEYGVDLQSISSDSYSILQQNDASIDLVLAYESEGDQVFVAGDPSVASEARQIFSDNDGVPALKEIHDAREELVALTGTSSLDDSVIVETPDPMPILGWFALLAVGLIGMSAVISFSVSSFEKRAAIRANKKYSENISEPENVYVPGKELKFPSSLQNEHDKFSWLVEEYDNDARNVDSVSSEMRKTSTSLKEIQSLMETLYIRAGKDQSHKLKAENEELLKYLNKLFSGWAYRDYLLNQHNWKNYKEIEKESNESLKLMKDFLMENIQKATTNSLKYDTMELKERIEALKGIDVEELFDKKKLRV